MTKKRAFVIGGLVFGDEGKGTTVDYLVRQYGAHVVIRYNGGSQAGHNVITPNGLHHCFAQFSSGTLIPGTLTYLSQFMFVDPLRLMSEYDVLVEKGVNDALDRLIINDSCPVITPFHKFTGQIRELVRGTKRVGSCGMGVGEAMNDFANNPKNCLTMKDLADRRVLESKLRLLQRNKILVAESILKLSSDNTIVESVNEIKSGELFERCFQSYSIFSELPIRRDDGEYLKEILAQPGTVVFEGAQGVLLDKKLGFKPFVTKSDCTFTNADRLLADYDGRVIKLGIARAYTTRHGNGPFITEDDSLAELLVNEHNVENTWQGKFRIGWFDLVVLKYAFEVLGKLDGIVMTNLDRVQNLNFIKVCTAYKTSQRGTVKRIADNGCSKTDFVSSCLPFYKVFRQKDIAGQFLKYLRKNIPFPLSLISQGPTFLDKKDSIGDLIGI